MLRDLLPQCVILTDGNTHDLTATKKMEFEAGDLLIIDRAYIDYAWLYSLHHQGVWFVTRLKTNACYEVMGDREMTAPDLVLADQAIHLSSDHGFAFHPGQLQRVHYWDPELSTVSVGKSSSFSNGSNKTENQNVLWNFEERRVHPNLDRLDRLSAVNLGQASQYRGLGLLELSRSIQTMLMERCKLCDSLSFRNYIHETRQFSLFNFSAGH